MKKKTASPTCPCNAPGENKTYANCCEPLINGRERANSAEQLMRSRYTAYVLGNAAYIKASWHASTRPQDLELGPPDAPHGVRWLGLIVHSHTQVDQTHAQVLFTARYREAGRAHRMQENSRFVMENGCWFYVDALP